jgi:FkbM family methyltransferase
MVAQLLMYRARVCCGSARPVGTACLIPLLALNRPCGVDLTKEGSGEQMIDSLAWAVQTALKAVRCRIVRLPKDRVAGHDFCQDVKLLVGTESPVCFDVGANVGQTIALLRRAFNNPRIYAFEPSRECFIKLQSEGYGPAVLLHNCALGEHNSFEQLTIYEDHCLSSFFAVDRNQDNPFRNVKVLSKESAEIKTIDSFVHQNQVKRIDLLKIDTQGYELRVLRGAASTFQKGLIDNVFIELNFINLYQNQSSAAAISDFLGQHDLYLVDYYEKRRLKERLAWCTALYSKSP